MKEKKSDILRSLVDLAEIIDELKNLGIAVDGQALLDLKEKLENDNFKVLVSIGSDFKCNKQVNFKFSSFNTIYSVKFL